MAHKGSADRFVIPRWTISAIPGRSSALTAPPWWCASGPIGVKSSLTPAAWRWPDHSRITAVV